MSTEQGETVPTPQEEPKPEEPKPEEPKPEEPKPEEPKPQEPKPEEPKPEEPQQEQPKPKEEPVKSKPTKPPVDYQTVKSGFVDRQGLLWKKWNHQWMTLDEGGSVLRWYKNEQRGGFDGQIYMKFCADVSEPKPETTTTWPPDTTDRCFVVCSPYRAYFLVAESAEEKTDWMQKLTAAKDEFNKEGRKVISTALISVEAATTMLQATADQTEAETNKALKEEGTSVAKIEKDINKAADDTEKELKKEGTSVEKEVDKAAKEVDKDVEKAEKEAVKEVDKAGKEAVKDVDEAQKEVEKDVEAKGEPAQMTVQVEVQETGDKSTEGGEESKPEGGD